MLTQILLKRIVPFLLAAALGFLAGSFFSGSGEPGREGPAQIDPGFGFAVCSRSGQGSGSGNAPDTPAHRADGKVTFLSKPKATYTDEARANSVKGEVTLRVTLLASGTVGSITVIKGLPDGLTEQAVEAARKIKFKPATLSGVPVSKVVTMQYGFNIY